VFTRDLAIQIADGKPEKFMEHVEQFGTKYTNVAKAIRAEMDLKKAN
jgi:hypothetical protein